MTRKLMTTVGLVAALAFGLAIAGQAADEDDAHSARVAVVVQVSAAPIVDEAVVARAALRHLSEAFAESERLTLIDPEATQQAARRIQLGARLAPRGIHRLADALDADRVVVVRLGLRDEFRVRVQGIVFNPRGRELFEFRTAVGARELGDAVELMGNVLVQHLLPALLKR